MADLDYPVDGNMDPFGVLKEKEEKKGRLTRIPVRAHFDRAGGRVDGEMTINRSTGIVTVREKRSRKTYSMTLTELVDHICRSNLTRTRRP